MAMKTLMAYRLSLIGKNIFQFKKSLTISEKRSAIGGFTLIELLIVIVVLSILGVVAVDLFSSVLKGTNKAQIISEVKQNGQFLQNTLERKIRGATDAQVNLDLITLTTLAGTEVIQFVPACLSCNPKTNGKITINGASVTNTDPLTGVDVTTASFSLLPLVSSSPKVVQVDITLNQGVLASTRRDFQANIKLTNTYSLRTY